MAAVHMQKITPSPPPPPSRPPGGVDRGHCEVHEVLISLTTPEARSVPWRDGADVFGHLSYRLDSLGSEPSSCHVDCEEAVSYWTAQRADKCKCPSRKYTRLGALETHTLEVCVAPGKHTIVLQDASGFGWQGANLTVTSMASGEALNLTALGSGETAAAATIPSAGSCSAPCPTASDTDATCYARLFDPTNPLCTDLRKEGCDCTECCVATTSMHSQWRAAQPPDPLSSWGGHHTNGSSSVNEAAFRFEIYPPFEAAPGVNATPDVLTELKRETIPCTGGRSSALLMGLDLKNLNGYVVGVQAIDRANNGASCGVSKYGRLTTDGIGQRAIIIDSTPPLPNHTRGSVLDVASLFQPPLPLPPDTDRLYARPAQVGCDWSGLGFSDAHSRMTGFEWALTSDG